jgi:hypothetical protein
MESVVFLESLGCLYLLVPRLFVEYKLISSSLLVSEVLTEVTRRMRAAGSSEASVSIYQSARRHTLEESNLHTCPVRENTGHFLSN